MRFTFRQFDKKDGPFTRFALHMNTAFMHADKLTCQMQTDTGSGNLIGRKELVKDSGQVLGQYSFSVILHRQYHIPCMFLQTDGDRSSLRSKLKGIRQQVGQYLFHLVCIHPKHNRPDGMLKRIMYLFTLRHIVKIRLNLFYKCNQVHFRHPHIHFVALDLAKVEQLADYPFQAVGIFLYYMYVVDNRRIGRQFFRQLVQRTEYQRKRRFYFMGDIGEEL